MALQHLRINGFRNLRDCTVEFHDEHRLNAVIGKNGSGKSNILEALLEILIGVYFKRRFDFEFELSFVAQGRNVVLRNTNASTSIFVDDTQMRQDYFASRLREGPAQVYYPELTFVYYSGECKRVRNLLKSYRRHFTQLTRTEDTDSFKPLFVQSSNDQADIILLALFAHQERRILELVSARELVQAEIVVRSPDGFDPKEHEPKLWNTAGAVRKILSAIDESSASQQSDVTGNLDPEVLDAQGPVVETRIYQFNDSNFKKGTLRTLAHRLAASGDNLYTALEHLRHRGLLKEVRFGIVGEDGSTFGFDYLSEGEKQLLAVIGSLRLTMQQDSLIFLDEPDTHLNPQWSWEYPDLLKYALSSEQFADSTVILTSHDPIMISGMTREQVWIARGDNGRGVSLDNPIRHPRGQGIANILCSSEYFGLPSSLDKHTQVLMDERLQITMKEQLNDADRERLRELNHLLEFLVPGVSERDPQFVEFLRQQAED